MLMILSILSPFIANENPLFIHYRGSFFHPTLFSYSEQDFRGDTPVLVNFHDYEVQKKIEKEGWIVWPPIPYGPFSVDYTLQYSGPQSPSISHWLGTDEQGRDLLARLLYALRFSLLFGLLVAIVSTVLGFFIGAIQGYRGGWTDLILQRIVEIWLSIPSFLVIIVFASFIPLTPSILFCLLVSIKWRTVVPMTRTLFLRARTLPYVEAARMMGHSNLAIISRCILPNVIFLPLARLPFMTLHAIAVITTIDFFGFSVPQSVLTLGSILIQGKNHLYAPWIIWGGIGCLTLLMGVLVFLGEALQKVFMFKSNP